MIQRLLNDYGVPFVSGGTHSHNTAGWVNVHCPFCAGTPNYHLGIREDGSGANCWRCGPHPVILSLAKVMRVPEREVRERLRDLKGLRIRPSVTAKEPRVALKAFKYPQPSFPLKESARNYLAKRGYDPDELVEKWGLLQTGPVSLLDKISYAHRIIIPIRWGNGVVSFQARDITGQSDVKYLACPKQREKVHHKHIVYGKPEHTEVKIVVEGPPDVWRLGEFAIATMGIKFTMEQVLNMSKLADRFFVLFDAERQAQKQARALASKLRALGKRAEIIKLASGDPGEMKQDEANHLVHQLTRRKPI